MPTKQEVNYAAILEEKGESLKTVIRPIPSPGPDEVLVRNYAIAANPVDWKMQHSGAYIQSFPTVLGSDGCGIITAVGSSVTKFKVGDRVTGLAGVIYLGNADHGAFQTYELLKEIATLEIPDVMTFEEGSVFPMAFATAAIALYTILGIAPPKSPVEPKNQGLLIWGASGSVGTAAIQLAKNAGFEVFATASPAHHKYLKSIGALEVFDYKDADVVSKIVASAEKVGTPISLAFDTVSEGETSKLCADILLVSGENKGSKLCLVLPWSSKEPRPEGIEVGQTGAYRTGTDQAELGSWLFNEYLPIQLERKTIVPAPKIEIVEGGIGALQKALDKLKAGVSGQKLVVKIE